MEMSSARPARVRARATALALAALTAVSLSVTASPPQSASATPRADSDWMNQGGYGIMADYLGNYNIPVSSPAQWNTLINNFDVAALAQQAAQAGAKWVLLPLGQNSGYYLSPNATYESIVNEGKTSTRDLPLDLANALRPLGIKLMFYLPSNGPNQDAAASHSLGETTQLSSGNYARTDTFTTNWSNIIRTWSDRYGSKVAGWWFDGAYDDTIYESGFTSAIADGFATAARHGNPHTLVSFNAGGHVPNANTPNTRYASENYSAGEVSPHGGDFNDVTLPTSRWTPQGTQWHMMGALGGGWTETTAAYSATFMTNFLTNVNSRGGAVTVEVGMTTTGGIPATELAVLQAVKARVRDSATVPQINGSASATSAESGNPASDVLRGGGPFGVGAMWHTAYSASGVPTPALPQSITYALGGTYTLTKFRYLPRTDTSPHGNITGYTLSASTDGTTFTQVTSGSWADDNTEKVVTLHCVRAAYITLTATAGNGGYASAANLNGEHAR